MNCALSFVLLTILAFVPAYFDSASASEVAAPSSSFQLAQKSTKKKISKKKKRRKKSRKADSDESSEQQSQEVVDTSSTGARKDKRFGAQIGGGAIIGAISGFAIEGFYALNQDLQLGISYMAGSTTLEAYEDEFFTATPPELTGSLVSVRGRYFIGNSFNISALLGNRTIYFSSEISSRSEADDGVVALDLTINSIMLGMTIGNHWAWNSGFTLGVDWFGYYSPLASSSTSTVESSGDATITHEIFVETVKDGGELIGKTPHNQALVITLGFLF